MRKYNKKLLQSLFSTAAPSFYESAIGEAYIKRLEGKANFTGKDVLGNYSAAVLGEDWGSKVVLAAHADEVGFVASSHSYNGLVGIHPLGYPDPLALAGGAPVSFHTGDGQVIQGVIHRTPIHFFDTADEEQSALSTSELFVDIGASGLLEASDAVPLGTPGVWSFSLVEGLNGVFFGRGADNKLSVYIVTRVMEELAKKNAKEKIPARVYGVLTSSEEVDGQSGAICALRKINPAVSVVLDVFPAGPFEYIEDTGADGDDLASITIMRGPMYNKGVSDLLYASADKADVSVYSTFSSEEASGDLDEIRRVGGGVAVGSLLLPARGIHGAASIFNPSILEDAVSTLVNFVMGLRELEL